MRYLLVVLLCLCSCKSHAEFKRTCEGRITIYVDGQAQATQFNSAELAASEATALAYENPGSVIKVVLGNDEANARQCVYYVDPEPAPESIPEPTPTIDPVDPAPLDPIPLDPPPAPSNVILDEDFTNGLSKYSVSGDIQIIEDPEGNYVNAGFYGQNYNSTIEYKNLGGLDEIYIKYEVEVKPIAGDLSRNVKLLRLTAGHQGAGYLEPTLGITEFHTNGSGQIYNYKGSGFNQVWRNGPTIRNQWNKVEMYLKLSDNGADNGAIKVKINDSVVWDFTGMTRNVDRSLEWITFPYYVAHDFNDGTGWAWRLSDYEIHYKNILVLSSKPEGF